MTFVSFHGAAKQVTGSCYLVEHGAQRLLVDCGLFQGGPDVAEQNEAEFGFDAGDIDFLLLTHAHLDHCGRIPLLVRRGFRGEIVATAATRELARLVMADAASLQEEETRARRSWRNGGHCAPLYTLDDALHADDYFGRAIAYEERRELAPGVAVRFIDAGHILGSASIVLELDDGRHRRTLVFSGDLGNAGRPILNEPTAPPEADWVVVESTYGDRDHRSASSSIEEFRTAVRTTIDGGGNVIIPTFALERAQDVLYALSEAVRDGALPDYLPVFLDSPMAITATEIFRRHPECLRAATRAQILADSPFELPGLRLTRDVSESMAINAIERGAVILAGSGMCNGGRVRHHLKHNLWRERAGIVFVGYAAEGTPARRIIDGAPTVRLFNEDVHVRARIWTINGFSAHAGQSDLVRWVERTGRPRQVLLTHGEVDRGMSALAERLAARGFATHAPGRHERVLLA